MAFECAQQSVGLGVGAQLAEIRSALAHESLQPAYLSELLVTRYARPDGNAALG